MLFGPTTTTTSAPAPELPREFVEMQLQLEAATNELAQFENKRQSYRADQWRSERWKQQQLEQVDRDEVQRRGELIDEVLDKFKALNLALDSKVKTLEEQTSEADTLDASKVQVYQRSIENGHLNLFGSPKKLVKAYEQGDAHFQRALQLSTGLLDNQFPATFRTEVQLFKARLASDLERATEPEALKAARQNRQEFRGFIGSRVRSTLRKLDPNFESIFSSETRRRFDAILPPPELSDQFTDTLFG